MRSLLLPLMTVLVLLTCEMVLALESTTSGRTPAQSAIPGQYIVVLKDEVRDPTELAREHAQRHGAQVLYTYRHALKGYVARIPDRRLDYVLADSRVAYAEPDQPAYAEAQRLPWGIDRVQADRSSTKVGNHAGAISNVNVYIIDSGYTGTLTSTS